MYRVRLHTLRKTIGEEKPPGSWKNTGHCTESKEMKTPTNQSDKILWTKMVNSPENLKNTRP